MKYLHLGLIDCFNYHSRMSRRAYWMFLFQSLIAVFIFVILSVLLFYNNEVFLLFINGLVSTVMLIPYVSAFVRRMHDINYSGWWVILYVPSSISFMFIEDGNSSSNVLIISGFVYFLSMVIPTALTLRHGTYGNNDYGEVPINELDKVSSKKYSDNVPEELRRYKKLFDDGIITEEEFVQKKREILNL